MFYIFLVFYFILVNIGIVSIVSKNKIIIVMLMSVTVIFVSWFLGFRSLDLGSDTSTYYYIYKMSHLLGNMRYEPGFTFTFDILYGLGLDFNQALFVLYVIFFTLLSFSLYLLDFENYIFAFVIIVSTYFFLNSYINVLRQGLSSIFILLAYACFFRKRKILGFIFIILAISYHYSALFVSAVMFSAYFTRFFIYKSRLLVSILFISFVFSYYDVINLILTANSHFVFFNKILSYSKYGTEFNLFSFGFFITLAVLFSSFCMVKIYKIRDDNYLFLTNIVFMSVCFALMTNEYGVFCTRIMNYLSIFEIILVIKNLLFINNRDYRILILLLSFLWFFKNILFTFKVGF